jgi:hypothetical protein
MNEISNIEEPERRGPSRRTVLKAAAWSVPVIAVAQASPAMAQVVETPSSPIIIDFLASRGCKIPGSSWGRLCYDKGYVLWARFTNTSNVAITINEIVSMVVGGAVQCVAGMSIPSQSCSALVSPVVVPANTTGFVVGIFSNSADDSANDAITVTLKYTPQGGVQKTITLGGTLGEGSNPWTPGVASCKFPPGCDLSKNTPPDLSGTICAKPGCT